MIYRPLPLAFCFLPLAPCLSPFYLFILTNYFKSTILQRVAIHLTVWLAVLSLPFLLRPDMTGRPMPPGMPVAAPYSREIFFLAQNVVLIAFFYLNYAVLIPRFLTIQRRRWAYLVVILLCFLVFQVLVLVLQNLLITPAQGTLDRQFFQKFSFLTSIFFFGLAWAASSGIRLNTEWHKAEKRRRESENERLKAELNQLKSQLNPHFLFNTLNGIYTLTLTKTGAASNAVLQLSHLLRYVMAETQHDFVPLDRDLEHLQHFVALHQMRLTALTPVTFTIEGDPTGQQVAPLLLLPFVENAFKFGSSTRDLSPIQIAVVISEKQLTLSCQNHIRNPQAMSSGIGIANTRRRLELLYHGRYSLRISEQKGIYTVLLNIEL